ANSRPDPAGRPTPRGGPPDARGGGEEPPVGRPHAHRDPPNDREADRQQEAERRPRVARERTRFALRGDGGFSDAHGEKRHGSCLNYNGAGESAAGSGYPLPASKRWRAERAG